ncbi:pancreatic lipase-related protein 2 isoform X2 [Ixodes scapularis]
MFKDGSLADRYSTALQMGFKAVECQFPYDTPLEEIRSRKKSSGLEQVLINSYPGDLSKGELGFAAKPGCEGEFLRSLETTLNYALAYHYLVNVQMSKDSRSSPFTGNFFLTLEGSKGEATVKVNRRTEELYPGVKYTFLVTTPSRVGVIKKASFKYKTDKIFFKSRMFLKHVEILSMNKPTRRT